MRDYKVEFEKRVDFIKSVLAESGAKGIVYGNSGGPHPSQRSKSFDTIKLFLL